MSQPDSTAAAAARHKDELWGRSRRIYHAIWMATAVLALGTFAAAMPHHVRALQQTAVRDYSAALAAFDLSPAAYAFYFAGIDLLSFLVCLIVGSLVFWHKPNGRMPIFVSVMLITLGATASPPVLNALLAERPTLLPLVSLLRTMGGSSAIIFFYLFPDGAFVPRFSRYLAAVWALLMLLWQVTPLLPFNPFYTRMSPFIFIWFGTVVGTQVYRYRRVSDARQRQQTKWVVSGVAVSVCGLAVYYGLRAVVPALQTPGHPLLIFRLVGLPLFSTIPFMLVPLSIGISVLRYQLWDINLIVGRTLQYGMLTGILALVYAASVLLLQLLIQLLTGTSQSSLAVAMSTVFIALLFQPLRQRLQALIDRAIYPEWTRQEAQIEAMYAFSQQLHTAVQPDELLEAALPYLTQRLGCDVAAALWGEDDLQQLTIAHARALTPQARMNVVQAILADAAAVPKTAVPPPQTAVTPIIRLLPPAEQTPAAPLERVQAVHAVPLPNPGGAPGRLLIASGSRRSFSAAQQHLLALAASEVGQALHRIHARSQAEQQRLASLLQNLPTGVLLLNADHRILISNQAARAILGAQTPPAASQPLTHLGDVPLATLLARGRDGRAIEIAMPGTDARVVSVQAQPIDAGVQQQWILVLRDVTDERKIQEQLQRQERLATVGQLAAGIAHDFNNIVSVIILYADLIRRGADLPSRMGERLNVIVQQGQRGADLVSQILDFSRQSVMALQTIDLVPFLVEWQQLLARILPETIQLTLAHEVDSVLVRADATRLQQVFMNLAVNARDAMPEGGMLRFTLRTLVVTAGQPARFPDMAPGAWVCVSVQDTGEGMAPEVLQHIFEPFFTTKTPQQGTGLGLAQVYGIVRQHGGFVDVRSEPGSGATFTVYLPQLALAAAREAAAPADDAGLRGQGECILVVEDDPRARLALEEILTSANYEVVTAENGRDAFELYRRQPGAIDLVLSDVVMP
ncbi:MAG: response regulator, partial [Anaerolineales bacterium]|nr:response regulator [Anaerolineales bacterium]